MKRLHWNASSVALALALTPALAACGDSESGTTDGTASATTMSTTGSTGDDTSGDDTTGEPVAGCEPPEGAVTPLRRMTATQYRNTVTDLFRGALAPSDLFPETETNQEYTNLPAANTVTLLKAEQIMLAAEQVGAALADGLGQLWSCPPSAADDLACAGAFIDEFGPRAYRRPLRPEEEALLLDLYSDARASLEPQVALGVVVTALLQSPQFLYFVEEGAGDVAPDDGALVVLSDWELATRLSYLLWDTMPDDILFAAAAAGELQTPAQRVAQAERLLADPRARPAVGRFFREWLEVGALSPSAKDGALFPGFDETLSAAMIEEFDRFVAGVVFDPEGGTLDELLATSVTEVDATMASFYGVPGDMSPTPGTWASVELDPQRRPGVLTRAALLAEHANAATSSAIHRGRLIRARILCDFIPPPPPGAMAMASFPEGSTQREQSEILMNEPACGGCHTYMNPIGLGFEHYDAIGAWREQENGAPVDASGEVIGSTSGIAATFDGAAELAALLVGQEAVHACFVEQWYMHALGLGETKAVKCDVETFAKTFTDSAGDLDAMIVAFVASEDFSARRLPEVSQ